VLVAERAATPTLVLPRAARAGALAAAAVALCAAFVGFVANLALAQSGRAARAGDWAASIDDARRARLWAPWSSEPWRRRAEAELALGETQRAESSIRRALDKDPEDWNLWFDLARATKGRAQASALARAERLNPLSPEIAELKRELAAQGSIGVVR
jgi:tetratricopeptide (TPR) repeat protein